MGNPPRAEKAYVPRGRESMLWFSKALASMQHMHMRKIQRALPSFAHSGAQGRNGIWLLQGPYADPLQEGAYCSWQLGLKWSKMCNYAVLTNAASPFVKLFFFLIVSVSIQKGFLVGIFWRGLGFFGWKPQSFHVKVLLCWFTAGVVWVWRKIATTNRKAFWMGNQPYRAPRCCVPGMGGQPGSSMRKPRLSWGAPLPKGKVTQASWAITLLGTAATFQNKNTLTSSKKN